MNIAKFLNSNKKTMYIYLLTLFICIFFYTLILIYGLFYERYYIIPESIFLDVVRLGNITIYKNKKTSPIDKKYLQEIALAFYINNTNKKWS